MSPDRAGSRRAALFLAIAIPATVASFTFHYGVDIPHVDDWSHLVIVSAFHDGLFPAAILWHPHNDHRALFPRLIIVGLALLTDWDLRAQMLATQGLMFATLLVLARSLKGALGPQTWVLPLVSGLLFSFHAWANWLWACQIHVGCVILAATGSLMLLGRGDLRIGGVFTAGVLGIVASWSFLSGFAVWPAGFVLLLVRPLAGPGLRAAAILVWASMAAIPIGLHLFGPVAAIVPAPSEIDLGSVPGFVSRYFGGAILGSHGGDLSLVIVGAVGQAALLAMLVILAFRFRQHPRMLAFGALGLFALAGAQMTAIGRSHGGMENAAASRYVTFAGLGWIAIIPGLILLSARGGDIRLRVAGRAVLVALAVMLGATQPRSIRDALDFHRRQAEARAALRAGEGISQEVIGTLFGTPAVNVPSLADSVDLLRDRRLSLFRDAPAPVPSEPAPIGLTCRPAGLLRAPDGTRMRIEVSGGVPGHWAAVFAQFPAGRMQTSTGSFNAQGVAEFEIPVPEELGTEVVTLQAFGLDRRTRVRSSPPTRWR